MVSLVLRIGRIIDIRGDRELWLEDASRIAAATKVCERVWFTKDDMNTLDGYALPSSEEVQRYGPVSGLHRSEQADSYADLKAFGDNAGRRFTVCGYGDNDPSLINAVVDMSAAGVSRVVLKARAAKSGIWELPLPSGLDAGSAQQWLWDQLGDSWALVQHGDSPGAFLLQEWVPMLWEYRIFVIDHEPVTGAGCVAEHTPLDNRDIFDAAMVSNRTGRSLLPGSGVERHPQRVTAYLRFAQQVTEAIRAERPDMGDYTLDVACNDKGPLIVELNGINNAGMYASDAEAIVATVARRRVADTNSTDVIH